MKHLFSVALEAKMPRLDDTGMDRSHCDFVNLLALNAVEVRDTDGWPLARASAPGVVGWPIRRMKTNGFEPWMAFGPHAVLLGELAFEEVQLRAIRRQRRKC